MARILFWNLQTFGINKVNSTSNQVKKGQGGNTLQQAAAQRWTAINGVINATNPDIVVIVEVGTGDSFPSALATNTGGWDGAVWLMNQLRGANAAAEWRMVPPLRVGRTPGSKPE